jgi:protein-L-isoaspartate(D-aspartate) O-methyltransferase
VIKDTPKHRGNRKRLIELIKEKGIENEKVLEAMMKVPRHLYMDTAFERQAYEDQAFKIGAGQTISQPYTVGFQTQLLQLEKGMKVLEIGTGSGYQSSVLHKLGCKVYSIERQKELFDTTRILLPKLGVRIKAFYGDGYLGLPQHAPFDRVIVTAGASHIPQPLIDQLVVGGILVIPVSTDEEEVMTTVTKTADGVEVKEHGSFRFVPMLGNKVWG